MPVMPRTFAMLQAIQYEMQRDPMIVYSQQLSIAAATRPDGKSINLLTEFGIDRMMNRLGQPIDEDWMANTTIGYGLTGHPAIVNIPTMTTMWAVDFVSAQAGMVRGQTGGAVSCQAVLWIGGPGRVGSPSVHANVGTEVAYTWMPGVAVVAPHLVYDAKGLMAAAIRSGQTVVLFNYVTEASADIPDEPFVVPIGKAQILKEGADVTIATIPPANLEVEKALPLLEKEGIKAEYFDPRTLKPFDEETLVKSVKKTGKLFATNYQYWSSNFGGHMAAVAAMGVPGSKFWMTSYPDATPPFNRTMATWMVPDAPKIVDAVRKFVRM